MARDSDPKNGGGGGIVIPFAIVTLVGAAGGGFMGAQLLPGMFAPSNTSPVVATAPTREPDTHKSGGKQGGAHEPPAGGKLEVRELPAVVANLAGGAKRGAIRLQSAIVYDPQELSHPDSIVASLMSDITAFLGTVDLASIEGPDGLRRLQEDLNERAATRSEHHIREFVIEGLVVQ